MRTKLFILAIMLAFTPLQPAFAEEDHKHEHGGQIFHMFRLETDYGTGQDNPISSWDFDGWIGGDMDKLWLKSEGEIVDGKTEQAEFWALYSRNIDTFWDVQVGIRQDTQPESTTYLVAGFNGLAPYFLKPKPTCSSAMQAI